MSASRSAKGSNNSAFDTYRQIAPESLDDQALRDIIKNNNNNHTAISAAIENIWHDIPDQKAVGSDWVSASKTKKDVPAKPSNRRNDTAGGRGSGARARGPVAGGRGSGDVRTDRGSRSSTGKSSGARASPSPSAPSPVVELADDEVDAVAEEPVMQQAVAPAPAPVVSSGVAASSAPAWGKGPSFAEKLKRAEAEKAKAEAQLKENKEAVAEVPASSSTATVDASGDSQKKTPRARRTRGGSASGKKSEDSAAAVSDVTEATEKLTVVEVSVVKAAEESVPSPPPLVQMSAAAPEPTPAPAAPEVVVASTTNSGSSEGFLKMGKWEAPVEAAEMSAFQFGSFGNAYDDAANNGVSASQVGTNPAATPWTGLHEDKPASTNVWGAPAAAEPTLDMSNSLFQQSSTSSAGADLSSTTSAATRAPPGLAPKNNNKSAMAPKGKMDAPQQATASQAPAQNATYNQGYSQPPGMNRNPALNALQYPYSPSFDLAAQQAQVPFNNYPLGGAAVPPVAATTAASSTATTTTPAAQSSAAAPTNTTAPNAALNQQQQQFPNHYGYYNPYYGANPYFYQNQMANFYNPPRGPYGANPYANGGSLYPGQDMYGQQVSGHFPDGSGNYGMHPGMQGAGNSNTASSTTGNNKAGKSGAGANNNAGAAQGMTQDQHANLLMSGGYGYPPNPYAGRGGMDAQGWQGYPGGQAGWGGQMMPFPNNASPTNVNTSAGFLQQQGGAQGQAGQQGARGTGNNNVYGGRGSGSAPLTAAGGAAQQW